MTVLDMLPALLLLIFGKLQNHIFQRSPVWVWALVFTLLLLAVGVWLKGSDVSPIINSVIGIYAWAYLLLLRRLRGKGWQWFAVYLSGALILFTTIYLFLITV